MKKLRIMYAEDELFLARIVCDGLKAAGYEVLHVADGAALLERFAEWNPQLCVLDIMLPGISGYELAREIRSAFPNVPIIFLSAKGQTEDIVKGFRSGGNDYLKKPFSIDELLIRIEALLTRFHHNAEDSLSKKDLHHFGNCLLDTVRHELTTSEGRYSLSYKETMLLELMLINANGIVERSILLKQVWGNDDHYTSRSMDVHLTRIRKLLAGENDVRIMNLRGVGYKLIIDQPE